jgi:hypothetical protein
VTAELDAAEREGWKSAADPIGLALRAANAAAPARERSAEETAEVARRSDELDALLHGLPWMVDDESRRFVDELAKPLLEVRRSLYPDYPVAKLARLAEIAWQLSICRRRCHSRIRRRRGSASPIELPGMPDPGRTRLTFRTRPLLPGGARPTS